MDERQKAQAQRIADLVESKPHYQLATEFVAMQDNCDGLRQTMQMLLEQRNSTGLAVDAALLSGIVPDQHPMRSRLEMLANHRKCSQAMAELLGEIRPCLTDAWATDGHPARDEPYHAELLERIDALLSGQVPERRITKPARVWGVRYATGIPEQTIIEAAYRYAEREASPEEKQAGKLKFDLLMAAAHKTVPEGWRLVPVEPTENMLGHGCGASVMVVSEVAKAWEAMLEAAPGQQMCESRAPERVRKAGGSFQHTGVIVSNFLTTAGEPRVVLEFDAPVGGMLHIYRPDQVEPLVGGE